MKFKKLVENKEIKTQKDLVDKMNLEVKDADEAAIEEHDDNVKVFKDTLKQCSLVEGYNYTNDKDNNYTVNLKNRSELAKLVESLKQNNIKHRISRSKTEGYRYDVTFKYSLKEDVEKTEVKKITTPRGTFEVVDKTEDELRKDGYGYHHSGNGYKIFVKNNQAVAIKECNLKENTINQTTRKVSKQKGNNTPITDEDQKKEFEAEDENNWNESLDKNNLKQEIKDACRKAFKEVFNFDDEDTEESLDEIDIEVQDYKDMSNQPCIRVVLGNGYLTRRGLEKLCKYVEDNVLSKYDKDAYFEGEDISSYSAIIRDKELIESNLANSTLKKGDKVRLDKEHNSNIEDKSLLDDEYEVIGFWNNEKVVDDDKAPENVRDLSGVRIKNTRTGKQYSVNRYQLTSIDESLKLNEDPIQDRLDELKQISRQRQLNDDEVKELAQLSKRKNESLKEDFDEENIKGGKLIDALKIVGDGFDITDTIFDWGEYFDSSEDLNDSDAYDKVMKLFADNIDFVEYKKDWYSPCKVSEFIEKNIDKFNQFLNTVYKEEYQPQNFEKQYTTNDEEFYDVYMEMMSNLLRGNFSEKDYQILLDIFNGKNIKECNLTEKKKQPKARWNANPEASAEFISKGTSFNQNLAGQPCCEGLEIEDDEEENIEIAEPKEDTVIKYILKIYEDEDLNDEDVRNEIVLDIIEKLYPDIEAYSEDWDNLYSTYEEKVTNILGDSLFESKKDDKEDVEEKEDEVIEDDNVEEISLDDINIDDIDVDNLDNVSIDDIVDEDAQALEILKDKLDIEIIEDEDSPILSIKEKGNDEKKAPELKVEVEQDEADKINNTFNNESEETNLPATTDEDEINFDEIIDAEPIDAKKALASLKGVSLVDKPKEKDNNKSEDEEELVDVEDDDIDDTSFLDKLA